MAKKGKKACAPKKKAQGYKMPPPIPPGEIIHDKDRRWIIGPSVGVGGFGEIYSACEYREGESPPSDPSLYPYVIKIEPMENGPLFVETHFYNRNSDRNDIQKFMEWRNLSQLGMPTYCGSGSHMFQDEEFRFLILERYGTDLWKTFKQVGRKFPASTVFQLGLQMLDVLDYIHSRSYIHADIKGANILMGIKEGTENQAYLLDFGLAYRIVDDNYRPDPKSAHEGTIEYTSIDRHTGAKTMRGDLEILGYNLLQWLVGELPWEQVLENPKKVHKIKMDFMNNVRSRITTDYPNVPDELIKFFEYIKTLEPQDKPDYTVCCKIFESYLTSVGKNRSSQLEFTTTNDKDLPLRRNSDSSKPTEQVDIESVNVLKNSQEQDATNKKRKSTEEIKMPLAKISKKIKTTKPLEDMPPTESNNKNELHENREQIVTKIKKNKNKRDDNSADSPPVENYADSEQPDDNLEQKVTKSKKDKQKKDRKPDDLAENYAENEQSDDNQDQIVTKTKKDKKKKGGKPDYAKKDLPDASQEPNVTKSKIDKQTKDGNSDYTPPAKSDAENEQPDDNQEQKVTKSKKGKKKKEEYPDDLADNYAKNEQSDDHQEQKVKKSKKHKIVENFDDLSENYAENELPDENQEKKVKKAKKNKKKKDKNPVVTPAAENNTESEQADDNQAPEVTKSKKNESKRDKKTRVANDVERELPDDNPEKPTNKKRRTSKSTMKNDKPKEKESDSESEFQEKKMKEKKKKHSIESAMFKRELPKIEVNDDTAPSLRSKSLRSYGKRSRTCFTNT